MPETRFCCLADLSDNLLHGPEFIAFQTIDVAFFDVVQSIEDLLKALLGPADLRAVVRIVKG